MSLPLSVPAASLLHGAIDTETEKGGWVRPVRFAPAQLRAIGSVRAWHPGYYRQLAACATGVTLEFDTDATRVSIELKLGEAPRGTRLTLVDVERSGSDLRPPYDGVSADVDGRHLDLTTPDEGNVVELYLDDPNAAPERGMVRLPGMGEPHRVRVWLPSLTPCSLRRVSSDGSYLVPVPEREQLLVLGDSIAQGFVSCDPALAWPALLADHLGLDLVNQGIGGQVFQPGSLAGLAPLVRPAAIVVEFGENYRFEPCQASLVRRDVRTYLYEVSEAWPDVPTWVLTRPRHLEDLYPTHPRSCVDEVDAMIRESAAAHPQMRVVNAAALLDGDRLGELLADGSDHPGPAGHRMLAERLAFVMDATREDAETRRARALELAEKGGDAALPLAECLRRGKGEVLLADEGAVVVELPAGTRLVMGPSRSRVRRALGCLGVGERVTMVCGGRSLAREVARATGGHACACHVVVWRGGAPDLDRSRDIRVLTTAYAGQILERYSHAEYLAPGELDEALAAGRFLGAFEEGRLVGFVGEHAEGAMGALEVFEGHRRKGWGTALVAAKVARTLELDQTPWGEVWPDNAASLALEKRMGFAIEPSNEFWVVA